MLDAFPHVRAERRLQLRNVLHCIVQRRDDHVDIALHERFVLSGLVVQRAVVIGVYRDVAAAAFFHELFEMGDAHAGRSRLSAEEGEGNGGLGVLDSLLGFCRLLGFSGGLSGFCRFGCGGCRISLSRFLCCGLLAGTCGKAQYHDQAKKDREKFFHLCCPPNISCTDGL